MAVSEIMQAVPASDMGLRIVNAVFIGGDGEASPLMAAMSMFSTCMLAIGSLMLAWHTIVALVATAHEGKPLGRWHTIWAPVRVSLGLALLIPAFNGATAGQLLVKELAIQSTTMASNVWATFSENMLTSKAEVPALETLGGEELAKSLVDKTFCAIRAQDADAELSKPGTNLVPLNLAAEKTVAGRNQMSWPTAAVVENGKATLDFGALCGLLAVPQKLADDVVDTETKAWEQAQIQNVITALNSVVSSGLVTKMYDSLKDDATSAQMAARPSREEWNAMLDQVAREYDDQQREAAANLVNNMTASETDHLLGAIGADGWIAAGTYWRDLSIRQRTFVMAAVGQVVSVSGTAATGLADFQPRSLQRFQRVVANYTPESPSDRIAVAHDFDQAMLRTDYISQTGDHEADLDAWIASRLASITSSMQSIMSRASAEMNDPAADPLGAQSKFGHELTLYGSLTVVSAAGGSMLKGLPIVGGAIGQLADLVMKVGFFLIAIGAVYAYVLPNLHFIFVLFLAFGWVVLLMESLIAVILFAFSLVRMDGDELMSQSHKTAALILLNFLIRPTLGVLGLCCVYYVLPILLRVVNELSVPAFFIAQGVSPVALVGLCAGLLLDAYIRFQLTVRTISLVTDLPDRISRWYGANGENLGETHHAEAAKGVVAGAALNAGRQVGGDIAARLGRRGPKQLEDPLKTDSKTARGPRAAE